MEDRTHDEATAPRSAVHVSTLGMIAIACFTALAACGSPSAPTDVHRAQRSVDPSRSARHRYGPFAVGRRTVTFVDTTRPTPANGSMPALSTRTLDTLVEYPTRGTPDPTVETEDAPPLPGHFPMVVYVHGLGAHADNPYLHEWAAAGFIAVAPTFPLTNHDAVGGPNRADAPNEPADVSFVISRLIDLRARDGRLGRVIDRKRIGVMGASLGATVADSLVAGSSYRDTRITAAIEQSCGCPPHPYSPEAWAPVMFMHGTADPFAPYDWTAQAFDLAPSPKYFLTLVGAQHIQYAEPWLSISTRASVDFFHGYLQHDRRALTDMATRLNTGGTARLEVG